MAHYDGYVPVDTNTYDAFKNAVNGNSYDVDYVASCQCVDLAKLLNYNLGYSSPYWSTGGVGSAWGGWAIQTAREFNAGNSYTLITRIEDIKRGDMIVYNHFTGNPYGHVGFADEDYNGTYNLRILSQNNGGTPVPAGGTAVNVANYSLIHFLGAFRLDAWQESPEPSYAQSRFKWVLYARRLRHQ